MMTYLSQIYKRVYKSQNLKDKNLGKYNPLDLYVKSTATMQKYLNLSEQQINEQTFHIILQHMENMSEENEQIEKNSRK